MTRDAQNNGMDESGRGIAEGEMDENTEKMGRRKELWIVVVQEEKIKMKERNQKDGTGDVEEGKFS